MDHVAIDIVGPMHLTKRLNKYLLVISDALTHWPEAYAVKETTAKTIAGLFVEQWCFRYGVPKRILSDQGSNFLSHFFREIC